MLWQSAFTKCSGIPTGVGALVARKSFLAKLRKPYFAGGTVEVVQCPGTIVHESSVQYERFEVRSHSTIGGVSDHVNRKAP
jgi:molybdenum cofactor sulfurtransferase